MAEKEIARVNEHMVKRELYIDSVAVQQFPTDAKKRREYFKSQIQCPSIHIQWAIREEIDKKYVP